MSDNEVKLNYDDIAIVPEIVTTIRSRSECCPYVNGSASMLPIFAAPMDTVVSKDNMFDFLRNNIYAILPRTVSLDERVEFMVTTSSFVAFSLEEAKKLFIVNTHNLKARRKEDDLRWKICIDMANGHMEDLFETVESIKDLFPDIVIMIGNIANPETYRWCCQVGVDYVRCNIGAGDACLTSSQTGIHFPSFSLLKEIYELKKGIGGTCKIIADGGIRRYRDIQKALIYADYVMIGSLFNKALESAGETTYGKSYWNVRGYKILRPLKTLFTYGKTVKDIYDPKLIDEWKKGKVVLWKKYRGMATKESQKAIADGNGVKNVKLKTSEGLVKYQKVEYLLSSWVQNETDYLRSAMSYTNSRSLDEYKDSQWVRVASVKHND